MRVILVKILFELFVPKKSLLVWIMQMYPGLIIPEKIPLNLPI
jgi:hypothetical protein